MSDGKYELVAIECELRRQTDKAGLFRVDNEGGAVEVWLPWSRIDEESECSKDGDCGTVLIPRWLAEEKELEYDEV